METEKITVRIPVDQVQAIDTFIKLGEFASRSEAIRRALSILIEETTDKVYGKVELMKKVQELQALTEEIEKLKKK